MAEAVTPVLSSSQDAASGLEDTKKVFSILKSMEIPQEFTEFNLSLARGLDYYTGTIFEVIVEEPKIGSLGGGGRYDRLIGMYTEQDVPAVGNSIGLERIITVMEELNMYPETLGFGIDVLICRVGGEDVSYLVNLANKLRHAGISTEVYVGKKNLRGQLGYADEKKIPVAIIAGGDEIAEGKVTLKNMFRQTQESIREDDVIWKINSILGY